MKRFRELCEAVVLSPAPNEVTDLLCRYFDDAAPADAVWTAALLTGRRPKRVASLAGLQSWAMAATGLPAWLIRDTNRVVGNMAETLALILPDRAGPDQPDLSACLAQVAAMAGQPDGSCRSVVNSLWQALAAPERIVLNRLISGGFRVQVPAGLVSQALARTTGTDAATIAHRLAGQWDPATTPFSDLTGPDTRTADTAPVTFAPEVTQVSTPDGLGPAGDWLAEWAQDGINAQIVTSAHGNALWSDGQELLTDHFPDLAPLIAALPAGMALIGQIVPMNGTTPGQAEALRQRLARKPVKKPPPSARAARFIATDLPRCGGQDLRSMPFALRRNRLENLVRALPAPLAPTLSTELPGDTWDGLDACRAAARSMGARGVLLRRKAAAFAEHGPNCLLWPPDPLQIAVVLTFVRSGRGATGLAETELTFALRDGADLVTFARTAAGLTDTMAQEVTAWTRAHTEQRFGPVRQVTPGLVFELAFDDLTATPRRKSGFAPIGPRILRRRPDLTAADAASIGDLRKLTDQTAGRAE